MPRIQRLRGVPFGHEQNASSQTVLMGGYLPMFSFDKSQTRKKTKRKTTATAKKMKMMTTNMTTGTRSESASVGTWYSSCVQVVLAAQPPENKCRNAPIAVAVLDAQPRYRLL